MGFLYTKLFIEWEIEVRFGGFWTYGYNGGLMESRRLSRPSGWFAHPGLFGSGELRRNDGQPRPVSRTPATGLT